MNLYLVWVLVAMVGLLCCCTYIHIDILLLFLGTFGLPKGIVISQPVTLVNDTFVPCKEYPVPERTLKIIKNIGEKMRDILNRYKEIAIEYLEAKRIYSQKSILERNKKTDFQI